MTIRGGVTGSLTRTPYPLPTPYPTLYRRLDTAAHMLRKQKSQKSNITIIKILS